MENNGLISTSSLERSARQSIKVIFEFPVLHPKLTLYRGVQATDGSYRMERRGSTARKFKTFMWCGSIESLYQYRKIVDANYRRLLADPVVLPMTAC